MDLELAKGIIRWTREIGMQDVKICRLTSFICFIHEGERGMRDRVINKVKVCGGIAWFYYSCG